MNKQELILKLEQFAPLETQEKWDASGWIVEYNVNEIQKVMIALTITEDVYNQAKAANCGLIISHHPLFRVPLKYKDIQMYCAHTNLDKARGGTTDTIIEKLGFASSKMENEFVRIVELPDFITVKELYERLKIIAPNLRYINNSSVSLIHTIGFCAGSGSEFIEKTDVDAFITGDLKYHTACETSKIVFDIGHFESEVLIKERIFDVLGLTLNEDGVIADEKSPFIY